MANGAERELYVIVRPQAYTRERRAVILAVSVPTVIGVASIPYFMAFGSTALDATLFLVFYLVSGIGITVGYHRYFTHLGFQLNRRWRLVLAICGYTAGQGPVVYWVANHRLHHARSDTADDPHSPVGPDGKATLARMWHAHVGWMFANRKPNVAVLAADLLRDPALMRLEKHYLRIYIASILLPGVIAGLITLQPAAALSATLSAGFLRQFLVLQFVYMINSVCHAAGSRRYLTRDHSGNVWWLSIPTLGESWHNNHHGSPQSARFGRTWYQLDIGYVVIKILVWAGIASHVKTVE